MSKRCEHIVYDNLVGTYCELTGASVPPDCGAAADETHEDASCVPKRALRYLRGERQFLAGLPLKDREAVMATASVIRERVQEGKLELDDEARELRTMNAEELEQLSRNAAAEARRKRRASEVNDRVLPGLEEERGDLLRRVVVIDEERQKAAAGLPVNVKRLRAAGLKARLGGRRRKPGRKGPRGRAREWTPEELEQLDAMREAGMPMAEVADALGRTTQACYQARKRRKRAR